MQIKEAVDLVLVEIKEVGQKEKIIIPVHSAFILDEIKDIQTAFNKINELKADAENLAKSAFLEKDKIAWDMVQFLLYYWNYRDLVRAERTHCYNFLVETALREIVLSVQRACRPNHQFESFSEADFSPEKAVKELAQKASSHRINTHPLLEKMAKSGLSLEAAKTFLNNYYVNNRIFHLFIAALSLSTPLERRTELANNFFDEMGEGDGSMAHPVLFLKSFNSFGVPQTFKPLSEAVCLANAKTYAAFLSGDYYFGMGGFGFIELTMPNQMEKILEGLGKTGIPQKDLEFWETHITIDLEHGKTWFSEMLHLIKTYDDALKCLNGGMELLEARATMYDGILRCQ